MTLTSTTNRVQYSPNGATTSFPVTFIFWDSDDLEVILTSSAGVETTWTRGTQYTVSGGSGSTGTVTVSTSPTDYTPASGTTLTIRSALANKQNTSLPAGGSFPSSSVEQQLDKIVRMMQQLTEQIGRALKLVVSSAYSALTVPDPESGKFLRWKTDLSGLENADITSSGSIGTPVSVANGGTNATTAATARSNLAVAGLADVNAFTKMQKWAKGADIASPGGGALTLGTDGNYFDITGTNAITSIGTVGIGTMVMLRFAGALTFTHHSTDLILPGGANITTAAGDVAILVEYASGDWRCVAYTKADGSPVGGAAAKADMEAASSTTKFVSPSQQHNHPAHTKGFVNFDGTGTPSIRASSNVTSITDDNTGLWTVNLTTAFSSVNYCTVLSYDCGAAHANTADTGFIDNKQTGSFRVNKGNGGAAADRALNEISFFGDQ